MNDLLSRSVPKRCLSASYVDDYKLYLSFSPAELTTSISALNENLMRISQWCCKNSLLINPDKSVNCWSTTTFAETVSFSIILNNKLWNFLNDNIKSLKCPKKFRRHFTNVLLGGYSCNYNIIVLILLINLNKNL